MEVRKTPFVVIVGVLAIFFIYGLSIYSGKYQVSKDRFSDKQNIDQAEKFDSHDLNQTEAGGDTAEISTVKPSWDQQNSSGERTGVGQDQEKILLENIRHINIEAFKENLKKIYSGLPRREQLKNISVQHKSQAGHSTSQAVLQAAVAVGSVADQVQKNPDLKPEAFKFYSLCANDSDIAPQVRAVCYERALKLKQELGEEKMMLNVPKEVLDLVGQ